MARRVKKLLALRELDNPRWARRKTAEKNIYLRKATYYIVATVKLTSFLGNAEVRDASTESTHPRIHRSAVQVPQSCLLELAPRTHTRINKHTPFSFDDFKEFISILENLLQAAVVKLCNSQT